MVSATDWLASKTDAEQDDSLQNRGSVVTPGGSTAIIQVAVAKAGIYEITAFAHYGGTADVIDNMEISISGTSVFTLPVLPVINGTPIPVTIKKRIAAGGNASIRSIAAGGAGSVFIGHLVLKRLSN